MVIISCHSNSSPASSWTSPWSGVSTGFRTRRIRTNRGSVSTICRVPDDWSRMAISARISHQRRLKRVSIKALHDVGMYEVRDALWTSHAKPPGYTALLAAVGDCHYSKTWLAGRQPEYSYTYRNIVATTVSCFVGTITIRSHIPQYSQCHHLHLGLLYYRVVYRCSI
jgi:hypothetical protein